MTSAVALHTHDRHELFYSLSGEGFQHTDRGKTAMKPGELYFFPAGQRHIASRKTAEEPCRARVVEFSARSYLTEIGHDEAAHRVLRYLEDRAWEGENRLAVSSRTARRVGTLLGGMIQETRRQQAGYATAVRLRLTEALLTILRDPAVLDCLRKYFRPSPTRQRLRGVLHYIETHYSHPIEVEQMAHLACLSRSHFHAVFKQETGCTLVAYVNGVRLRAARDLLRRGEVSILMAAQQCGFSSVSYFYHCFRNLTGQTPKQYATQAAAAAAKSAPLRTVRGSDLSTGAVRGRSGR